MGQWGFFDDQSDNAYDAWADALDRAFNHEPPKSLPESRRKIISSVKLQLETESAHETKVGLILLLVRFLKMSLQEQRESLNQGFMARIGAISKEVVHREEEQETGQNDFDLDVTSLPHKFPISLICIALDSIETMLDRLKEETKDSSDWADGLEFRRDALLQERDLFETGLEIK